MKKNRRYLWLLLVVTGLLFSCERENIEPIKNKIVIPDHSEEPEDPTEPGHFQKP